MNTKEQIQESLFAYNLTNIDFLRDLTEHDLGLLERNLRILQGEETEIVGTLGVLLKKVDLENGTNLTEPHIILAQLATLYHKTSALFNSTIYTPFQNRPKFLNADLSTRHVKGAQLAAYTTCTLPMYPTDTIISLQSDTRMLVTIFESFTKEQKQARVLYLNTSFPNAVALNLKYNETAYGIQFTDTAAKNFSPDREAVHTTWETAVNFMQTHLGPFGNQGDIDNRPTEPTPTPSPVLAPA